MILHQQFVRIAKQNEKKLAVIDRTLDRRLTYKRLLIGSLLLVKKFEKYDPGFLGIMMPNSAGSVLAILAALMGGRVPVMINYSTGAAGNCEYAQKKCAFKTIITSRALCQKINCQHVEGMIYLEDVMKTVSVFDKIKATRVMRTTPCLSCSPAAAKKIPRACS
jgi:acyl-[acyl-carrier-protein]-phospholipid O-acyltransferase/long-chain-fatty-acid--[acyl-carrier-protein] ligase